MALSSGPNAPGCHRDPGDGAAASISRSRDSSAVRATEGAVPPAAAAKRSRTARAGGDNLVSPPASAGSGNGLPRPVISHVRSAPVTSAARARRSEGGCLPFS